MCFCFLLFTYIQKLFIGNKYTMELTILFQFYAFSLTYFHQVIFNFTLFLFSVQISSINNVLIEIKNLINQEQLKLFSFELFLLHILFSITVQSCSILKNVFRTKILQATRSSIVLQGPSCDLRVFLVYCVVLRWCEVVLYPFVRFCSFIWDLKILVDFRSSKRVLRCSRWSYMV